MPGKVAKIGSFSEWEGLFNEWRKEVGVNKDDVEAFHFDTLYGAIETDDIQFGSFMRRFENAVYGVWHYPQEAANRGIEGETAVRITFNRKGVIEDHEILRSSGSEILDNEVIKTLNLIGSGSVGPLPKGYKKDKFNVIAFFQYGIVRGLSRTLH